MPYSQDFYATAEIIFLLIIVMGTWNGMRLNIGESGMTLYPAKRFFFPKKHEEKKREKALIIRELEQIKLIYLSMMDTEETEISIFKVQAIDKAIESVKSEFKGGI